MQWGAYTLSVLLLRFYLHTSPCNHHTGGSIVPVPLRLYLLSGWSLSFPAHTRPPIFLSQRLHLQPFCSTLSLETQKVHNRLLLAAPHSHHSREGGCFSTTLLTFGILLNCSMKARRNLLAMWQTPARWFAFLGFYTVNPCQLLDS